MVEVDKSVCSAGFMIYCTNTQYKAKGTVVEKSDQADNYRGEILGGLMIQLVLRAAAQTSHSCYAPVRVDCDNIGVVRHGNSASKKLKAKQSQADVLRSLKQLITSQVFDTIYEWVASHQDDKKKWKDLTLRERMNVIVDKLAKLALITGIVDQEFINSDFPFEQLRLRVGGKKITGSIKTAVSNHWAYGVARKFYHSKKLVPARLFDLVYWDGVELAMAGFPKRFRSFVTKHVSKFCGTNKQLARFDKTEKQTDRCPSCGMRDEDSKHITCCKDPARRKMLALSTKLMTDWMATSHAPMELIVLVKTYVLAQDSQSWCDSLPGGCTNMLHTLAVAQDSLGWDNFVEGRVSTVFLEYMKPLLDGHRRRTTPRSWCVKFMTHLLALTHKQWLFRNSHVHLKKLEGLTTQQHDDIFEKVKSMLWTDPADLLEKHKYLLEEDFHDLGEGSTGKRQIWIASMESALKAAALVKSGRRYRGDPGLYVPATNYIQVIRPSAHGSIVYKRLRRRALV
jgi:hypothetical protein